MKLLAVAQAFLAAVAVADQVWPLSQYDDTLPTFTTQENIILTWDKDYFNPYIGVDESPKTFTLSIAAYNNTPTGSFINIYGQLVYTYEVSTLVEISNKLSPTALSYSWKPKLINGWEGKGYWYWFDVDWVGKNGIEEDFGTKTFYLTD